MHRPARAATTFAASVALTAVTAALLPGTAAATTKPAPKPVCLLVVDPVGDAAPVAPYGYTPRLDIRSADVATGTSLVAAAIRVTDLADAYDLGATGGEWRVSFSVGTARYTFAARRTVDGAVTTTFTRTEAGVTTVAGPATAVLDVPNDTIKWTAARSAVVELAAAPDGSTRLDDLAAETFASPLDVAVDTASSTRWYFDGHPSCLTV